MSTEAFSVRADSEKIQQLDTLAEQMEQSRNDLVNQAINRLLELHTWQAERTREGIAAADEGRFVSDKKMEQIFNRYGSD